MNRLEQIEAREKAATPGPWDFFKRSVEFAGHYEYGDVVPSSDNPNTAPIVANVHSGNLAGDGEYIAHARQDIPALLAVVRHVATYGCCCVRATHSYQRPPAHDKGCPLAALLREEEVPE